MAKAERLADDSRVRLLIALLKFAALISEPMLKKVGSAHDITLNEIRVLMSLNDLGEAASHELAEMMAMAPMNVSRAVAALCERGHLDAKPDADNRRRKKLRLTPAGRKANRALLPQVRDVAEDLFADFGEHDMETLRRLTAKMLARLERHHRPGAIDS